MTRPTPYQRVSSRVRALPRLLERAPRAVLVVAGLAVTVLGVLLVTRPLSSLAVLGVYIGVSAVISGVGDLVGRTPEDGRRSLVTGVLWVVAGVVVLVWFRQSLTVLGPAVAVLLLVTGVSRLLDLLRGVTPDRAVAALFGLSEIAFAAAALLWPDATLVVVALLFGMRSVVLGVSLLWRASGARSARGPEDGVEPPVRPGRSTSSRTPARTVTRWVAAVLLLLVAGGTLGVSHAFRQGVPVLDGFYDAPPTVPAEPGRLLRSEPYDGDLPAGLVAYRILYTTTADDGVPGLASAVLAVPSDPPEQPVPLVAWAHGTVGIARACAPSLGRNAVSTQGMPSMDALARNGWAMVATDYIGQGTEGSFPYLVGQGEGRSVLDSVRAAHELDVDGLRLADQTVIWGHSQGGHAALWAGQLVPEYAPELDVVGTAALSPASDPVALAVSVTGHPGVPGASLGISFVAAAYARTYPDITLDDAVNPSARPFVDEAAARCTSEPGTLVTALTGVAISRDPILRRDPTTGVLGRRLSENVPLGPWPAPVLVAHGQSDEVIDPAIQDNYVAMLCERGVPVAFRPYAGRTHMSVLEPDSPLTAELERWTLDRLAGRAQESTCPPSGDG
ncbi:lipase family protein [Cellulomonas sp. NS3]|uniref:lipase family protein n=1 Tax=Cellulomonas sp. NS3 TaxID=2973977 RepID=UPI0021618A20|nr:lipase family protein [Cellulomonas sp. NS3]